MATTDILPAVRTSKHDPVELALRELARLREETEALIAELRSTAPAGDE
jgi:hypothetical protein